MPRRFRGNDNHPPHRRGARGGPRGRGRGRGASSSDPTTDPPARARQRVFTYPNDIDVAAPEPSANALVTRSAGASGATRGRARGGTTPRRAGSVAVVRGTRGSARGRGLGAAKGARPLSDLLYAERPLLRPVTFVRATSNPLLFERAEDMLRGAPAADDGVSAAGLNAEGLEEVDFADLGRVRAEIDAIAIEGMAGAHENPQRMDAPARERPAHDGPKSIQQIVADVVAIHVEEQMRASKAARDAAMAKPSSSHTQTQDPPPDAPLPFVVDTSPSLVRAEGGGILFDRMGDGETLGDDEEERIVYVAPNPRSGHPSPASVKLLRPSEVEPRADAEPEAPSPLPAATTTSAMAAPAPQRLRGSAHRTQVRRMAQIRRRQRKAAAKAKQAVLAEDTREIAQPQWETQRRDDSDVDWGTEDEKEDEEVELAMDGMDVDPVDTSAMQGFLASMSVEGSRFVTMDDIEDEARMRLEDEDEDEDADDGSESAWSGSEEEAFHVEEEDLMGESASEDEDGPESGYGAHLRRARPDQDTSDEDENEAFMALIRGGTNERAPAQDDPAFTTPVRQKNKNKGKHLPPELAAQWHKDRAKKAARKQARQALRQLASTNPDPPPPSSGKMTKAQRKAQRAARAADAPLPVVPLDTAPLEAQIRAFIHDAQRRPKLVLPPMEKAVRACVHELALAFGLKSVSTGKGAKRHATLMRTPRTVNEHRVRSVVARYSGKGGGGGKGGGKGVKGGGKGGRDHREGDEVGKAAPKIGEGNLGFRMLASMGWSEGDVIGTEASVGIHAPLTAIIKHSKLGLGATRGRAKGKEILRV